MRLPPRPVLLAAKRWLEILPGSGGIPRAQALLTTHPRYDDLTPTQYATGLSWLRELGLADSWSSAVPASQQLLASVFEKAAPSWFQDADYLVRCPDDLPEDIGSVGETLGLAPDEVFEQLVSSWRKVDAAGRAALGAVGEIALVEVLRAVPGAQVKHVAAQSDGFGYDVEFEDQNSKTHLEVKSSTRLGRFTAYLSRHEYDVMKRDDDWQLVVVRLTPDHELAGVGSVCRDWIAENAPRDSGTHGSWATVKLDVPPAAIEGGIRRLGALAADFIPDWN